MKQPNYILSNKAYIILSEIFELPKGLRDFVIEVPFNGVATVNANFLLRYKNKRTYDETLRDIEKGLKECRNIYEW